MRLIGTFSNETQARRLSSYFKGKGIESNCDIAFESQTGQLAYHLWVLDEDRIKEAASDLDRFLKTPSAPEFDPPDFVPVEPKTAPVPGGEAPDAIIQSPTTPLTSFFLGLCIAIFFLNWLQEIPLREENLSNVLLLTPIQSNLLYDLPPAIEAIEETLAKHPVVPGQTIEDLAPQIQKELQVSENTPSWRGFYDWTLLKLQGKDTSLAEGPLFFRIRQGEIWRLFSPCVLHSEFLHILFNMIWLWVLCRPIEAKLKLTKTLLLTLVIGIGSNTIQYLMSGPLFIGYSGVIMGLAGFIWMRQKIAPWEGYPLNKMTILFLALFVGSMFLLTFVSFFLQLFAGIAFAPNIANTAHIAGALIGACLGRFSYFSWRAAK